MRKLKNEELNRLNVDQFKKARKSPIIIVLDNIRSLNNVGSIFRTADAFLVEKIYLCGITAKPPHKDIRKTALGATESVAWEYRESAVSLVDELNSKGHTTLAVEQVENAIMLNELRIDSATKYVLVFGHEVKGVAQEVIDLCEACVEIPQFGTKHSLNISVSAGVAIWHLWANILALSK